VLPSLMVASAAWPACGDAINTIVIREAAQRFFDADIMLTRP
jgi:hypothetical protein